MKVQLVVAQSTGRVICTAHDRGRTHDFRLLKKSRLPLRKGVQAKADSGYQGVQGMHPNSRLPHKATKCCPLTEKQRAANRELARERIMVEHVIGQLKVFRILSERYRNRRQNHTLRVRLICGIHNYEL